MRYIKFSLFILAILCLSCEKKLDISEFRDDFGNYQPELKVEGLLQQDDPASSVIRIIQTSTVTNRDVFNGVDDDGDGIVDEDDEIIPLIQDTSATVKVTNLNSGEVTDFQYFANADSVVRVDSNNVVISIPYGGYKPASANFQIENYAQYSIEIQSRDFQKTITGVTTVYPPVTFIDTLYNFAENFVTMNVSDQKELFWTSDPAVTAYYMTFEEITEDGLEYYESYTISRDNDLTELYSNVSVGKDLLWGLNFEIVLKLTIEAFSPEYGRYIFSELPLNDPQRSNLRDENGYPVMGCFGAAAADTLIIIIEE